MKKMIPILLITLAGSGCTHKCVRPDRPVGSAPAIQVNASQGKIVAAAKKVLRSQGLTVSEGKDGVLTTAPVPVVLTADLVDCGADYGTDCVEAKLLDTTISYRVVAEDGRLEATALITGKYRVKPEGRYLNPVCYSRGVLEQQLLDRIYQADHDF